MSSRDYGDYYIVRAEWVINNQAVPAIATVSLGTPGQIIVGTDEGTFSLSASRPIFLSRSEWLAHHIDLDAFPDNLEGRPIFKTSTAAGVLRLDACPLIGLCAEAVLIWQPISREIYIEVHPTHSKPRLFVGSLTFDPITGRVIANVNGQDMFAIPIESLAGIVVMARRENFSVATVMLPKGIYQMPLSSVIEFLDHISPATAQ